MFFLFSLMIYVYVLCILIERISWYYCLANQHIFKFFYSSYEALHFPTHLSKTYSSSSSPSHLPSLIPIDLAKTNKVNHNITNAFIPYENGVSLYFLYSFFHLLFKMRVQPFTTTIQNSQKATIFKNLLFLVLLHAFPHVSKTS